MRIDPHGFRRAVHASGCAFVVWYLLPEDDALLRVVKGAAPAVLLAIFATLEALRMAGRLRPETLFGLREYERGRAGGYLYFGASAALLLYFTPEAVAVPCLVGTALLDPLQGELRLAGRARLAAALGFGLAGGLFALSGWAWWAVVPAAALMVAGELVKLRHLDDDLLMPLFPATLLLVLAATGLHPAPPGFLAPEGPA